jgi:crossover junction endodeoxyribonuclease RuvC
MTVILGVDPGSRKTGFGVIRLDRGATHYVSSGIIKLPTDEALPQRLKVLFAALGEIIEEFNPGEAAIEQVFMAHSADSALKLGQARGAAVVACASRDLPVHEYSARQIKQAVVGTGAAGKEQVQHMVMSLLKLPAAPKEDAADALACALCHVHGQALRARTGAVSFGAGRLR